MRVYCDCVGEMDAALEREDANKRPSERNNTQILSPMFGGNWCFVETTKRDDSARQKSRRIIPVFCPFCGLKYGDKPATALAESSAA